MDPNLLSPLVGAAVTALADVLYQRGEPGNTENGPTEKKIKKFLDDKYESFRTAITDNCAIVLKNLERGDNLDPSSLRERVYPQLVLNNLDDNFDAEFRYRLEYLTLLGLVTRIGGSEYAISKLGLQFLRKAREHSHYKKVLFPENGTVNNFVSLN